jgi:hypothetical protein
MAGSPAAVAGAESLQEVLASDLRQSSAACPNVAPGEPGEVEPNPTLPPNAGGPTPVEIYLFVLAVDGLDPATNSFRFVGYGGVVWCDPRLAFDADAAGADFQLHQGRRAWARLEEIWSPGLMFPSQLGAPERTDETLTIYADGTVGVNAKFSSRMTADYDFTRFPVDRQHLRIAVQLRGWEGRLVELREASNQVGLDPAFEIPEWSIEGYTSGVEHENGVPRYVMEIEIRRLAGFYLWKILGPLIVIVGVAWSTFWMTQDALAQRQRQSATALLSVVAYQFVAAASLPRVPYLTLMDGIFLWTYLCVAITLVTNVRSKRRFRRREERGRRADRRGRVGYPVVYLAGMALLMAVYSIIL